MKNIVTIVRNSVNGFKSQMDAGTNSFSEEKDTAEKNLSKKHHRELKL